MIIRLAFDRKGLVLALTTVNYWLYFTARKQFLWCRARNVTNDKLLRDQVPFSKLMANAIENAPPNKPEICANIINKCQNKAVTSIKGQFDIGGDFFETDPCEYWLFGFADYSVLAIFEEQILGNTHYIASLLPPEKQFDRYELRADMVEYELGQQFILPRSLLYEVTGMWTSASDKMTNRLSASNC